MLSKTLLTATLLAFAATPSMADITSFSLGGYSWQTDVEGGLTSPVDPNAGFGQLERLDVSMDNFTTDTEANFVYFAELRHSFKYVPNVRLSYASLEHTGTNGTVYIPPNYSASGLNGSIDLSHYDVTGFYTVWDDIATVDVGLTGRFFDGELNIEGIKPIPLDTEIALLFARVNVNLPLGFAVEGELNAGDDGDQRGIDYTLLAKYKSPIGIGVAGGYRRFDADLQSDTDGNNIIKEVNTDLTFAGPIFYIFFSF